MNINILLYAYDITYLYSYKYAYLKIFEGLYFVIDLSFMKFIQL